MKHTDSPQHCEGCSLSPCRNKMKGISLCGLLIYIKRGLWNILKLCMGSWGLI